MKKKISIFWTTILIILPLVLIADVFLLLGAYGYVRSATLEHYEGDIENAAEVTNILLKDCDLKNPHDAAVDGEELCKLCDLLELPYIYVLEIDEEAETIKYLTIGTGQGATKEFLENRHIGDVVPTKNIAFYHDILNNDNANHVRHVNSKLDDTMIYYLKRTGGNTSDEVIATEISVVALTEEIDHDFRFVVIMTLIFTAVIIMIFALIIKNRIQKPAKIISQRMIRFVHDRKKGHEQLEIKSSKEFSDMADSFNAMAQEIDRYLDELSEMNRQKAEFHIARDIQKGLLEPPECDFGTACVKAVMLPAKDVGGDLYDYIELQNGNICVIIADVSGKGVSAALFMSRAITLLHQYAESGMSPGRILYEYNNHLADRNPNLLFITSFVGIYDPKTNELTYANAGHNYPYLISDRLICLDGEQGMAAGIIPDQTYPEHTVSIQPNDLLFLYTDGVNEAKNKDNRVFSDEALEKILTDLNASSDKEAITPVLEHLKEFTKGTKQTDDITMLTLKIKPHSCRALHLEAKKENLTAIYDAILDLDLPKEIQTQLRFMAEEMFINICSYAYPDTEGSADILIEADSEKAVITFIDTGVPFDPTDKITNIEEYDIDNDIGGLGRYLTFSYADDYSYKRDREKNILRIEKRLDNQ